MTEEDEARGYHHYMKPYRSLLERLQAGEKEGPAETGHMTVAIPAEDFVRLRECVAAWIGDEDHQRIGGIRAIFRDLYARSALQELPEQRPRLARAAWEAARIGWEEKPKDL